MMWTNDPVADAERYAAEQEKRLRMLPLCSECGEHIQDEHLYEINDEYICERCMNENHRKAVDDIVC